MWDSTRRLSNASSCRGGLYEKLEHAKGAEERGLNESFTTLNLEFNCDDKNDCPESLQSLSLTEGFEMQDTTGGHCEIEVPTKRTRVITRAVHATEVINSSDSEEDTFVSREARPLVKI